MTADCYACRAAPAGFPANPYSAYCAGCQPCSAVAPAAAYSECGRCQVLFGSLASFEDHLVRDPGSPVIRGCTPPRVLGLVQDGSGTWQTPEGLARRERTRAMTAQWNRERREARHGPPCPGRDGLRGPPWCDCLGPGPGGRRLDLRAATGQVDTM